MDKIANNLDSLLVFRILYWKIKIMNSHKKCIRKKLMLIHLGKDLRYLANRSWTINNGSRINQLAYVQSKMMIFMTVRYKSKYENINEKIICIDNDSILEISFKWYILKNGLCFINNNFPNGVFNRACFLKNDILHHFLFAIVFFFCMLHGHKASFIPFFFLYSSTISWKIRCSYFHRTKICFYL